MTGVTERHCFNDAVASLKYFQMLWLVYCCYAVDSWSTFWVEPPQGEPIAPFKEVLVPTLRKRHIRLWTSNWFSVNTSLFYVLNYLSAAAWGEVSLYPPRGTGNLPVSLNIAHQVFHTDSTALVKWVLLDWPFHPWVEKVLSRYLRAVHIIIVEKVSLITTTY